MKNNFAGFLFCFIFAVNFSFLAVSCDSEVIVKISDGGKATVSFAAKPEAAFLDTIFAVSGDEGAFDKNEIKKSAEQTGLSSVGTDGTTGTSLAISGKIPSSGKDLFSKSGILEVSNNARIAISTETLKSFYESCPSQFQSYIDLFMAPVLSGEEMTDEEYIELIEEVYGKPLADEFALSEVRFIIEESGKTCYRKIRLCQLLNLKETIEIK